MEEGKQEGDHEKREEKTITIKKQDLWKYSTFALVAVLVVVAIVAFSGESTGTGGAVDNDGNSAAATGDLSPFLSNSQLYPSLGPSDSDNLVIEFADFQCPYCALAAGVADWTADYASRYGDLIGVANNIEEAARAGELRFIYVPWAFLGQESIYATEAALCANDQGKFWEMHDAIFAAGDGPSENDGKYEKDKLKVIAAEISGLNTGTFNDCLDNDDYASAISRISSDVAGSGVTGTPTIFVNGKKVSPSWEAVQAALN